MEAEAEAMKIFFNKIEAEAEAPSRSTASKTLIVTTAAKMTKTVEIMKTEATTTKNGRKRTKKNQNKSSNNNDKRR